MNHTALAKLKKALVDKEATEIQKWLITADGIKRQYRLSDGSRGWQRLPAPWWKNLDEIGRKDLLNRLNVEDWRVKAALEKYEIKSAFIPEKILSEFERKLHREMGKQTAESRFQNLKKYCLEYFLPKSPNPIEWQRDLQEGWVDYLVSLDYAPSTYKHIRIALNKFMRFLAAKNPDLPTLIFDGLTPHQIQEIRYQREIKGLGLRYYIPRKEADIILKAASPQLKPYIQLIRKYGLRRNEARALTTAKIKNSYLFIDEQIKETGGRGLPKYRKTRKIPHWYSKPKQTYKLIEALEPYETGADMSKEFSDLTKRLVAEDEITHPYVLHDWRHTFITDAVEDYSINEVMLAAGHADIRTTSKYLKDKRKHEDETYVPKGA